MTTLLDMHSPPNPAYGVIDGRHRLVGAVAAGVSELRCDILTKDGKHGLRRISVQSLTVDPDVQFPEDYRDKRSRAIAAAWDDRIAGTLTVVPLSDGMSAKEKSAIKLGLEQKRRRMDVVETFRDAILSEDPESTAIGQVVKSTGWVIGKSGNSPAHLTCISALKLIYSRCGQSGLSEVLNLAGRWRGDVQCGHRHWIEALGLLERDGYIDLLQPQHYELLEQVVPSVVLRQALGDTADHYSRGGNTGKAWSPVAYAAATRLRKAAKLKTRPATTIPGKGSSPRPI